MAEAEQARSVDILMSRVQGDSNLINKIKNDPVATLREAADEVKRQNPPRAASEDTFTFRLAVVVLSLVIVLVVCFIGVKYFQVTNGDIKVPEILVALGSTALGALAGLLTPQGRSK